MPIPLEPDCWDALHTMSSDFGQVFGIATNYQKWDKGGLEEIGHTLVGLANKCMLLRSKEQICREPAEKMMEALIELLKQEGDDVDPLTLDEKLEGIGQPLADLQGCLYDHYAIANDQSPNGTLDNWPDDGWIARIRPERVTQRKY